VYEEKQWKGKLRPNSTGEILGSDNAHKNRSLLKAARNEEKGNPEKRVAAQKGGWGGIGKASRVSDPLSGRLWKKDLRIDFSLLWGWGEKEAWMDGLFARTPRGGDHKKGPKGIKPSFHTRKEETQKNDREAH